MAKSWRYMRCAFAGISEYNLPTRFFIGPGQLINEYSRVVLRVKILTLYSRRSSKRIYLRSTFHFSHSSLSLERACITNIFDEDTEKYIVLLL